MLTLGGSAELHTRKEMLYTYEPYLFHLHILFVMSKARGVQYSSKCPHMIENMIAVRTSDVSPIIHPSRRISQFLAGGMDGRVISFRTVYLRRECVSLRWNQVVFVIWY